MLQRAGDRTVYLFRLGYGGLNHRRIARSERVSTAESMFFALKHLKSGPDQMWRTRIFKDGSGRELNNYDGSGASGCGLRQSGWASEDRGLQWDGLGCFRAFVDSLRPGDCWGLGETTDDSPSLVCFSFSFSQFNTGKITHTQCQDLDLTRSVDHVSRGTEPALWLCMSPALQLCIIIASIKH